MLNETRRYRQPRRINAVSVALLVLLAVAGYTAVSAWPVVALNTEIKNLLGDALPRLHRANLLPEPESTIGADQIRLDLVGKLTSLGIANPEAALTITRNTHVVAIVTRIDTEIDLKLIRRKIPLTLNPRVETTAERVSY